MPFHSLERGVNENMNGIISKYNLKWMVFIVVTDVFEILQENILLNDTEHD